MCFNCLLANLFKKIIKERKRRVIALKRVFAKEIEDIKGRLEAELGYQNLPLHRKVEVEKLVYHLNTWLDWKKDYDRKRYRERLQSESWN